MEGRHVVLIMEDTTYITYHTLAYPDPHRLELADLIKRWQDGERQMSSATSSHGEVMGI